MPQIDRNRADRARRLHETGRPDPAETALAKRQAVVRDTFQRSIDELRMSPSLVDQVKAQSLKKFVAAMPEPVPNSMRATQIDRAADARIGAASAPEKGIAAADPIAAALARTQATIARIEARRAGLPTRAVDPVDPITAALARTQAANARIAARRGDAPAGGRPMPSIAADPVDPIGAVLARTQATNARIGARRADVERPDPVRPDDRSARAVSERVAKLVEQANRPRPADLPDRATEIMRKTLESERARKELDRTRDRSGPSR